MTAKEIAEKYVYGTHDARTDSQEIADMTKDIQDLIEISRADYKPLRRHGLIKIRVAEYQDEIQVDKDAYIEKGHRVYFEGTEYGNSFNRKSGIYFLGDWDSYYGFKLYDVVTMKELGWADSTRMNTFKVVTE